MKNVEDFVEKLIEDTIVSDIVWRMYELNKTYITEIEGIRITIVKHENFLVFTSWELIANGHVIYEGGELKRLWNAISHRFDIVEIAARTRHKRLTEESKQSTLALLLKNNE